MPTELAAAIGRVMDSSTQEAYNRRVTQRTVVVAGCTGYIGKFAVVAFKQAGYRVRALTRNEAKLAKPGPFHAPAVRALCDEVAVAELTKPERLGALMPGADVVFSSVGISRQRDGLSFEQVDYQCNRNLIDAAVAARVPKFVYVSMWGADDPKLADLAITVAHERVVRDLAAAPLAHRIIRPGGYFSDMGVLMDMAKRGRSFIVGPGTNRFNPVHGLDVAEVAVAAVDSSEIEHGIGGPDVYTQDEAAQLAFEVLGKPPKLVHLPMGLMRFGVRAVGLLNQQLGDLFDFIVTAGEVDGVAPRNGKRTLRAHFEELARQ